MTGTAGLVWDSTLNTRSALRPIIASRAVVTAQLIVGAALVWFLVGVLLGTISALRPRSIASMAERTLGILGVSMPVFVFGLVALYARFKLHSAWMLQHPLRSGYKYIPIGDGVVQWLSHMILPWAILGLLFAFAHSRIQRIATLDTLDQPYVRTARAKGLSQRRVFWRHTFRPSLLPSTRTFGWDLGLLAGSAILTEVVFGLPGLGSFLVASIQQHDAEVLVAATVTIGFIVVLANLAIELVCGAMDPRVRRPRDPRLIVSPA